jgi:4-hydroxy-3-methylbut-2-enyl diphosphate reductase
VAQLLAHGPDLMLVVGGYNSSNTGHLCEMASAVCPTYHITGADCLVSAERIRHKPAFQTGEVESRHWLPAGKLTIGLTSGASTPDRILGEVMARLIDVAGESLPPEWSVRAGGA